VCVCTESVHLFAVLLQSLYHGINVTKGFVKNILKQHCYMKEQYFLCGKRGRKG